MSNILDDSQIDSNISSTLLNDHITLLDSTFDYINPDGENIIDVDNGNSTDSNTNLSNTSNTTPEFSSPNDTSFLNHQFQNYDYSLNRFKHHKSLSFSLPDKLNLLLLKNMSKDNSKSPSPEFIYHNIKETHDERTINPQQLFTSPELSKFKNNKRKSVDSVHTISDINTLQELNDHNDNEFQGNFYGLTGLGLDVNTKEDIRDYILPSSSSSPNLSSIFNQNHLDVDFKMNNECFNAIKIWLNNNDLSKDKLSNEIVINPTGIIKNSSTGNSRRRNSIQLTAPTVSNSQIEKRKRRKSTNSNSNLNEFKSSLFSLEDNGESIPEIKEEDKKIQVFLSSQNNQNITLPNSISNSNVTTTIPTKVTQPVVNEGEGKPFPCPNCTKQFKRLEHLKRHIRSVHSNIRPFHCKYCEKQFSRSDNLAQHLKTHYKVDANGATSIIYGNPNVHNRGGRRKNSSSTGTTNNSNSPIDYSPDLSTDDLTSVNQF